MKKVIEGEFSVEPSSCLEIWVSIKRQQSNSQNRKNYDKDTQSKNVLFFLTKWGETNQASFLLLKRSIKEGMLIMTF